MKYKVLGNLKHDGMVYEKGQEVFLPESDSVVKLVTDGVLEALSEPVVEEPKEAIEEKPVIRKRRK